MRTTQELLGALIIGRWSTQVGGGGEGSQRKQISPQATRNLRKRRQNFRFPTLTDLKIAAVFLYLKVLNKYTPEMSIEEYMN
jgi:hypothetical protein